jgi:ABC-type xylose transport system permease subunit
MPKKVLPDTYTFIVAAAIGLVLGTLLSYLFGSAVLPTKIPFEFTIGGFSSNLIIVNILVVALVSAVIFLGYVAAIVQDTVFPAKYPWLFIAETAVVAFVPASVIYIMTDFRGGSGTNLNLDFLLLAAKFAVFHLLFQFSGVYTYFFSH